MFDMFDVVGMVAGVLFISSLVGWIVGETCDYRSLRVCSVIAMILMSVLGMISFSLAGSRECRRLTSQFTSAVNFWMQAANMAIETDRPDLVHDEIRAAADGVDWRTSRKSGPILEAMRQSAARFLE